MTIKCCITSTVLKYWNGIAPGCIHKIFKFSRYRCSTRSEMALDIPLQETKTEQKRTFTFSKKIIAKKSCLISKTLELVPPLCMF